MHVFHDWIVVGVLRHPDLRRQLRGHLHGELRRRLHRNLQDSLHHRLLRQLHGRLHGDLLELLLPLSPGSRRAVVGVFRR